MGSLALLELLFFLLILFIPFVLFLIALIDILKNSFKENINKLIWVIIVFIPILGPILYYFVGRKQKA